MDNYNHQNGIHRDLFEIIEVRLPNKPSLDLEPKGLLALPPAVF